MKFRKLLIVALSAAGIFAATAGDLRFHRGGVSFPMEKISAERFNTQGAPRGENLIKNGDFSKGFVSHKVKTGGWRKGCWYCCD